LKERKHWVTRNQQKWPLWTVVILSLPTFAALLIVISGMLVPNVWVYFLIPLAVVAPVGFVSAIGFIVATRRSMDHRLSRAAWIVLVIALLAGIAAITIIRLGLGLA
jgi:uncharacterized membrane-anchored protein